MRTYPKRWVGKNLNIEGLVEDFGIQIIARPHLQYPVVGYAPKDPKYIVVSEKAYEYLPNLRHTLSEELSHTLLEHKLYKTGKLPAGAECYSLSAKKHKDIEDNADMLASALLLPKDIFKAEWARQRAILMDGHVHPATFLKDTLNAVSTEFNVLHFTAARRAKDLYIVTHSEYKHISTPIF